MLTLVYRKSVDLDPFTIRLQSCKDPVIETSTLCPICERQRQIDRDIMVAWNKQQEHRREPEGDKQDERYKHERLYQDQQSGGEKTI